MSSSKSDVCLVCGAKTKGLHFQVVSCRACSEFFRRSTQAGKVFKCQRRTKNCDLTIKIAGIPKCRYCRYKKCKEIMIVENLETDEKSTKKVTTQSFEFNAPSLSEPIPEQGIPISEYTRLVGREVNKIVIDVSCLDKLLKNMLNQIYCHTFTQNLSFFHSLNYVFIEFYDEIKPKDQVTVVEAFNRYAHARYLEKFTIALTKMLMKCKEFATLNYSDKFLLLQHAWPLCHQLERHYSSVLYFGNSLDNYWVMHDETTAIDFGSPNLCIKDMTIENFEKAKKFFIPTRDKFKKNLMDPLKTLKITPFEFVYLLAQMLWNIQDIPNLSENAQQVGEKISDQISHDMHNYYVNELRLTNYAPRLVKLSNLIEVTKDFLKAKKEMFVIGRVFDMFACSVVGSELCDYIH